MLVLYKETPSQYLRDVRQRNAQNARDEFGIPTLCAAIEKFRSVDLVRHLLQDGAMVDAFTCMKGLRLNKISKRRYSSWREYSAIHIAVSLGQHEIVTLLLEHGGDLRTKTEKGVQCLDLILSPSQRCQPDGVVVSENDDLELIKLMYAANLDLSKKDEFLFSHDTLLHRATKSSCLKIIRYLISVGFDVNCRDKISCTSLHYCKQDYIVDLEAARTLLESKADSNAQNDSGDTLCHHLFQGYKYMKQPVDVLDLVYLLHEYGANPNVQNHNGETVLHACLASVDDILNPIRLVDFMLRQGAGPNMKDIFGRTPVFYLLEILKNRNADSLDLIWSLLTKLVYFGARLDYLDFAGLPLLHALVNGLLLYSEHFEGKLLIELLTSKCNVDVNVQDYYNRTVLHLVAAQGNWQFGEIFLNHGGNAHVLDCDGNTPLNIAVLRKKWKFARNLLLWPLINDAGNSNNNNNGNKNNNSNNNNNGHNSNDSNNNGHNSDNNTKNQQHPEQKSNNNHQQIDIHCTKITTFSTNKNRNMANDHTQNHSIVNKRIQRRNSMPLTELRKQDQTASVTPMGSSVKWTRNELEKVGKFITMRGTDAFLPITTSLERKAWEIEESPVPKISEKFLRQINKSSLLRVCEENCLAFHLTERCSEEHCLMAKELFTFIQDLLQKCSEMDPRLKSKLHWTGSSSEGTKMWLPDEFDFLMELVELQDCCYIEDSIRYKLSPHCSCYFL